jgi:hypothetical protein
MMAQSSPQRPHFEPDGASLASTAVRDHAISSAGALARFEFEAGCGNEGTKILMVEWKDEEESSSNHGNWEVSWEGKGESTILSENDRAGDDKTHRLYFLLGPGVLVPSLVKIAQNEGKTMQTNPLPAIFSPQLGATARAAGKKGVLHTIYAKKRLSVLQREIDKEMKIGGEGIGLDLAIKEKEWIEDNFGIGPKYTLPDATPSSPRSPGGGRIAEKMKGLKLATGSMELTARPPGELQAVLSAVSLDLTLGTEEPTLLPGKPFANPLSPETGDHAISSFAAFHGGLSRPRRAVAQTPPSHIVAQQAGSQGSSGGGMASLDAVADGKFSKSGDDGNENDDGLFAVTMSPRSPEMTKSPFSFSDRDIQR